MVDEAHYAQSLQAHARQLCFAWPVIPACEAIWMLTGTPMKNGRPSQLYPLLAAMDHPIARDQRQFEESIARGTGARSHRQTLAGVRASQLEELRRLNRPLILHRRKQQVVDLPPKQRRLHPVELSEAELTGFDHRVELVLDDYRRQARLEGATGC